MTCNHCQEQLLNYLYDVLDDAERAPIAAHLDSCPMCQSARNGLRAQQELLAEAAKESFAAVTFQPPAETPKRLGEPTLAMPRRQRGFSWVRVALAASVLMFVVGGGSMGIWGWFRTKSEIELAEARVQEAKKREQEFNENLQRHRKQTEGEIRAIQEEINKLFDTWNQEANKERKKLELQPRINVQAPANTPAGANVQFNLNVANLQGGLEMMKKSAATRNAGNRGQLRLVDQANQRTIWTKEIADVKATNSIQLPPLPIAPDTKVVMNFELINRDGKVEASEEVTLTSPEYLTHLMTDRPMYRPNEVVRFRSLTLERFSLKPAQEDLHLIYRVLGPNQQELFKIEGAATLVQATDHDQQKSPIQGPDGKPLRGLGAGEFPLSPDLPGGQYTITVSEAQNRFPPEKRTFLVNQWQMPRMNKELTFNRSSYGPDEVVVVNALAKRGEGGAPLAGQKAIVNASVDGNDLLKNALLHTDGEGKIVVSFKLPPAAKLPRGIGSVSVEFHDGAGPETIVRPIPIVLNKLFVEFFPEGGDLIQGVANRVYFQAKNTIGKPAELKGRIVDHLDNVVAATETLHDDREEGINQGQGSFMFTPAAGKKYELKIDAPLGIQGRYPLPETKTTGVVVHLPRPVADETIDVEVTSADTQRLLMVGAYCRGRLLDQRQIGAPVGKTQSVTLKTQPGVSGVYRVTVYEIVVKGDDMQYIPRAERLTYRKGAERVNVALDGVKEAQFPGAPVKLKLTARDEKEKRVPVVAMVSVVDLSLIKLADDKTERGMPTHFMLTSEIRQPEDFENADVLLGKHPKAEAALDLLLGTQGWRRFAEQDPVRFQQKNTEEAQRILALMLAPKLRGDSVNELLAAKVDRPYAVKALHLQEELANKEMVEHGPQNAEMDRHLLQQSLIAANSGLVEARSSLHDYEQRIVQYLLGTFVIGLLLAGLVAIGVGIRRLGQGRSALASLVTGTALLLFLFMGSLAGVFYMIGSKGEPVLAQRKFDNAEFAAAKNAAPPPMMMAPGAAPAPKDKAAAPQPLFMEAAPAPPKAMADGVANADKKLDRGMPAAKAELVKGPEENVQAAAQLRAKEQLAPAQEPRMGAARGAPQAMFGGPQGMPGVKQQPGGFGGMGNNAQMMQLGQGGPFPGGGGAMADAFMGQGPAGFAGGGRANNFQFQERALRANKDYQQILNNRMRRQIDLPAVSPPLYFREYAHRHVESQDQIRRDFTETVCWRPALVLPGGEVEVAFDLSDAVTRYQVTVFSHTLDGRLGADRFELAARLPFSIDPKVPFEVCNTDKIVIPVAVKNETDQEGHVDLTCRTTGLKTQDPAGRGEGQIVRNFMVGAKERGRGLFMYEPAVVAGDATVRVKGVIDMQQIKGEQNFKGNDTVERSFKIVPDGFPMRGALSGLLEKAAVHEITLPNSWLHGTLQCQVQVFPSTLAELQKGLEGLLREPNGCFEQSSSSNYPNVLILNYLQEAGQGDANVEKRARGLIQSGYQKLTSFECLDPTPPSPPSQGGARGGKRGYEWFGQTAPPHEALTAYGLLQFRDMAKVYAVDKDMVERTKKYLLGQRDGQGGFKRNTRALDSFGRAPDHITNAYIVWALTDAAVEEDLTKELAALAAKARGSKDPYFVALVALGHANRGKNDDALALAKNLKAAQKDDGRLEGTQTSITGSQGRDLQLETTALAVLAWLKANRPDEFHQSVEKAVKWINAQRSGQGSFGATQSTILALKALIAHTRDAKKIAEDGKLTVTLPGRGNTAVAETSYTAGASEPITLALQEGKGLQPGKNKVLIETTGKNAFPYTVSWSYQTLTPPSDAGCPVRLSAKLSKDNAEEGETVKLKATVENTVDMGHGMTVAILGLPAGLSIPEDAKHLKEMAKLREAGTKPGIISHWELKGRELVLYWRDLAPKQKIDVELDLICRLPGTYRGPASRAYLYYNADAKTWIEPLGIVIDAQRAD